MNASIAEAIAAMSQKSVKVPMQPLKLITGTDEEKTAELCRKWEVLKQTHKYVTYMTVCEAWGIEWHRNKTAAVIGLVEAACGKGASAQLVDSRSRQSSKVHAMHRETLKAQGYTILPSMKPAPKAKKDGAELL